MKISIKIGGHDDLCDRCQYKKLYNKVDPDTFVCTIFGRVLTRKDSSSVYRLEECIKNECIAVMEE